MTPFLTRQRRRLTTFSFLPHTHAVMSLALVRRGCHSIPSVQSVSEWELLPPWCYRGDVAPSAASGPPRRGKSGMWGFTDPVLNGPWVAVSVAATLHSNSGLVVHTPREPRTKDNQVSSSPLKGLQGPAAEHQSFWKKGEIGALPHISVTSWSTPTFKVACFMVWLQEVCFSAVWSAIWFDALTKSRLLNELVKELIICVLFRQYRLR